MHWLNLQTSVLHSPEFVGCRPVARATWLAVMLWCVQQENGGRIAGARTWNSRRWQQTCGVTLKEIDASGPLLSWEGDDLVVWSYPMEKEIEVRERRTGGAHGGSKRTPAKIDAARRNGILGAPVPGAKIETPETTAAPVAPPPTPQAHPQAHPQGKGKEGNGKEKKATGHARDDVGVNGGGGLIAAGALPAAERPARATAAGSAALTSPATAQLAERIEHGALLGTAAASGLARRTALGPAVDAAPGPGSLAQTAHSAAREMAGSVGLFATAGFSGPAGLATATGISAATGREPTAGGGNGGALEGAADSDGQGMGEGGLVPTLAEVMAYGSSPHGNAPEEVCAVWWNDHEARPRHALGGYTDRTGQPVRNWRASLRAFALRWRNQEEQRQQQQRRQPPPRGPRAAPVPRALQGPQRPPAVGFRVGF